MAEQEFEPTTSDSGAGALDHYIILALSSQNGLQKHHFH